MHRPISKLPFCNLRNPDTESLPVPTPAGGASTENDATVHVWRTEAAEPARGPSTPSPEAPEPSPDAGLPQHTPVLTAGDVLLPVTIQVHLPQRDDVRLPECMPVPNAVLAAEAAARLNAATLPTSFELGHLPVRDVFALHGLAERIRDGELGTWTLQDQANGGLVNVVYDPQSQHVSALYRYPGIEIAAGGDEDAHEVAVFRIDSRSFTVSSAATKLVSDGCEIARAPFDMQLAVLAGARVITPSFHALARARLADEYVAVIGDSLANSGSPS
ncbi:hypothetical protein [Ramlibacter albus]|uniref:Uncharacterized protein n=1 Tax=Ramlibacter albus TaxID=2079448 RepID=A0A923M8G7_9BURK|nr:hypothetical protein [Ramlibacter albus]MBC5765930.1 hypothetical protein [Ramlibacter albus]